MTKVSLQAEEGARLVKQGKPEEAIREFERALAHDAQDGNALLGLARLRLSRGENDAGRALLRRLLKVEPEHAEAQVHLARLDAAAGDEKALAVLRKLAASKDADAFVLLNLGQALLTRGRFEDAAEAFERALRLQPEESSVLLSLGIARQGQGKGEQALQHFQKATEVNPSDYQAPLLAARLLVHQGQFNRALTLMKQALERVPDKAELYPELIQLYLLMGETKGAMRVAAEFRTHSPRNAAAAYLHGLTNMMMGYTQEAERLLNASLSLDPKGIDARLALANMRRTEGDQVGALKWLEEAWKLNPQAPGPACELAVLFMSQPGGAAQAVQLLRVALGAHPDEPSLNLNMALALADSDVPKAREHALRAKAWGPKSIREHAERLLSRLS
ncbi:tetratricopeptide repeat protein [Cystobacter fuscus]|uniref:tetratricopeptide repeat protein n=1 Tax=Cystobacter fuscus TaxID=43 RepID=UPI002B2E35BC|nr:tetratricopeptide repeat protein [Cystobacter fuscus]